MLIGIAAFLFECNIDSPSKIIQLIVKASISRFICREDKIKYRGMILVK
jgi:hypothetical protein